MKERFLVSAVTCLIVFVVFVASFLATKDRIAASIITPTLCAIAVVVITVVNEKKDEMPEWIPHIFLYGALSLVGLGYVMMGVVLLALLLFSWLMSGRNSLTDPRNRIERLGRVWPAYLLSTITLWLAAMAYFSIDTEIGRAWTFAFGVTGVLAPWLATAIAEAKREFFEREKTWQEHRDESLQAEDEEEGMYS